MAMLVRGHAQNVFHDCCLKLFSFHNSLILRYLQSPSLISDNKIYDGARQSQEMPANQALYNELH